ncbi:MAG: aldehyde dehydrogenase family protein [Propionicimonas sp.]|nr:aldehyde dehydrogenase family protein [Propionicimonas sp.]
MDMLVNGIDTESVSGERIEIRNPATGELLDSVPRANNEDVDIAVRAAKVGARVNSRMPAHQRYAYLTEAARLILANLADLIALLVAENGKSQSWADFEIRKGAEVFQTLAERVKDPQGATYPMDSMFGAETGLSMLYKQPLGIVGAIVPFNFPVELMAYKLAGALAAGNSVVVKLPEDCPLTCLRIGKLLQEAGAPVEAFQLITGFGHESGAALVRHPDVSMISFTGSTEVGKDIAAVAGSQLKKISLELGGNDPVIVFEDADLKEVAGTVVKGRMTVGNGQACVADKVWLVQDSVADKFGELVADVAAAVCFGDPADSAVEVGPLISEKAADRVIQQVQDAVGRGAKLLVGGEKFGACGVKPTVLIDVPPSADLIQNECFGPVVPIVRFTTEEEAIGIANSSRYGLQGAVHTRDISRAMRVADQLEVGGVVVNGSSCFRPGNVPYMPRKESGIGRDNMFDAVDEMTVGKAVIINGVRVGQAYEQ